LLRLLLQSVLRILKLESSSEEGLGLEFPADFRNLLKQVKQDWLQGKQRKVQSQVFQLGQSQQVAYCADSCVKSLGVLGQN